MRLLCSCIVLFIITCSLSLHAAAQIEVHAFPDETLDVFDKRVRALLVALPNDVHVAEDMLFAWNGTVAASSRGVLSNTIPRLDQLYGLDAENTLMSNKWRQSQNAAGYYKEYNVSDAHWPLSFDLLKSEKISDILLLKIPVRQGGTGEDLCKRLQLFVDNTCRQLGLDIPQIQQQEVTSISVTESLKRIAVASGVAKLSIGNYTMIAIGLLLFFLAIVKGFEPLLLVPIAAGCIFVNAAGANMGEAGGLLHYLFTYGIETSIFPLLIFMGVGALTDFGPLLANPWMALLGGAAQFGIFGCFVLAVVLDYFFGLDISLQQAGAIAIIGGADGPTSIYVASKLAPELLGAIAVAAYSYMALVPLIQPPIMRLLTNDKERRIMMTQRRIVSKRAKILFPIIVILLCILTLPEAVPLIGMLMLGNLMKESGVVDRLSNTAQNELINLVTIGLGLSVGMKMSAAAFLDVRTLGIFGLGIVAFIIGTAAGVIMAKILNILSGGKINPLIGSAGVSAVPMAARVSQNEGSKYNKSNFLLMHAMGPNVAGVIGSAVAAGILLSLLK